MAARSKRLAGPVSIPDNTVVVLGTVPAGKTWLVKSIRGVSYGSLAGAVFLYVGAVANANLVCRLAVAALSQTVDPDTDPIVLSAGEVLRAALYSPAGAGPIVLTISGAELDA